ncbi:1,4-dihydroxy-6-naphthoate synthase [Trichlorobacter thiogenes]|uniref:1,4-dihydroxy-6-naphtoate synthase n=1 Tax=Trichlorobacter thiogenes TaxID=115783 RepID=A0A1T4Q955_9BACT|nr:1,4-dihydroxy-6-naphthoate synthase [Trichlorobacter thiogenes]SJZ99738.1 1,4-dihydroxy-6-naphthoate synthase [Trichlorobacter thiogenes]
MKNPLTLGFSPCPNDTFMFYPLVHGLVDTGGYSFNERLEDVETLNKLAVKGVLDVTKVSYAALGHFREQYALLRAGSALGRGCGPLLVAKEPLDPAALQGKTIAIPGRYTTAHLLMRLYNPSLTTFLEMPFHEIMDAVMTGRADAGVIIHESRFTYQGFGLHQLVDLGEWWENETGLPIPLGGIVAKRSLGADTIRSIEQALAAGVEYARSNPAAATQYIREHAQEMNEQVCAAHIGLYVNDFSQQLGAEGEQAITELLRRAEAAGIVPASDKSLFI